MDYATLFFGMNEFFCEMIGGSGPDLGEHNCRHIVGRHFFFNVQKFTLRLPSFHVPIGLTRDEC